MFGWMLMWHQSLNTCTCIKRLPFLIPGFTRCKTSEGSYWMKPQVTWIWYRNIIDWSHPTNNYPFLAFWWPEPWRETGAKKRETGAKNHKKTAKKKGARFEVSGLDVDKRFTCMIMHSFRCHACLRVFCTRRHALHARLMHSVAFSGFQRYTSAWGMSKESLEKGADMLRMNTGDMDANTLDDMIKACMRSWLLWNSRIYIYILII